MEWCENGEVSEVEADAARLLIRAKDILQPGTLVHVLAANKAYYEEMEVIEYRGAGDCTMRDTLTEATTVMNA